MTDEYSKYKNGGDKTDALPTGKETKSAKGASIIEHTFKAARMPTDKYACEYNMKHKKRGIALIFNNEHFDIPSLKSRTGTNIDCANLRNAWERLDFEVTEHKDCKYMDIVMAARNASSIDHTDHDCVAVAILSHGENGYIYARDVQYRLDDIMHCFAAHACPTLAGKPKLFFVQACRGDRLDQGISLERGDTETDGDSSMSYKIPIHADFLVAYSTIPGFYSWRNVDDGSWFIQALVAELNANGKKEDLLTLLTFVNQRVALDFESQTPDKPMMHRQKQIPCITTMLTRIVRFADAEQGPYTRTHARKVNHQEIALQTAGKQIPKAASPLPTSIISSTEELCN